MIRLESAKYEIQIFLLIGTYLLTVFTYFFMDPDPNFSRSDPDLRPIRIRTQEKKFDPDPEKNRTRNTDKNGFF